jgi:NTE family protein
VDYVGGVSAGAIVAAAWASGANSYEIENVARTMTFKDVARWKLSHLGLAGSERMIQFLGRLLKCTKFEEMKTRLAVVATDVVKGEPVVFHGSGDVIAAVRASCSYPGLFLPMQYNGRFLVDGAITMEIPAKALRDIGARHVISVGLPMQQMTVNPQHMLSVVTRCFQIMMRRTESEWRRYSNAVITPDVANLGWDSFIQADQMIAAGRRAAEEVLPRIEHWLRRGQA